MADDALFDASEQKTFLTGRPYREFPEPAPLDKHGPATVLSMVNRSTSVPAWPSKAGKSSWLT